jgi:hypothetical protein
MNHLLDRFVADHMEREVSFAKLVLIQYLHWDTFLDCSIHVRQSRDSCMCNLIDTTKLSANFFTQLSKRLWIFEEKITSIRKCSRRCIRWSSTILALIVMKSYSNVCALSCSSSKSNIVPVMGSFAFTTNDRISCFSTFCSIWRVTRSAVYFH